MIIYIHLYRLSRRLVDATREHIEAHPLLIRRVPRRLPRRGRLNCALVKPSPTIFQKKNGGNFIKSFPRNLLIQYSDNTKTSIEVPRAEDFDARRRMEREVEGAYLHT